MLNASSPSEASTECCGTQVGARKLRGIPAGPLPHDCIDGVGARDRRSADHTGACQSLVKAITEYDIERREAARRTSTARCHPRRTDKTVTGRIFGGSLRRDVRKPYGFKRPNFGETSANGTGDDWASLVGHFSNVTLEQPGRQALIAVRGC